MKITFISNYLNHHQLYFCNEMYKKLGNDFVFIATNTMSNERRKLGYEDMNDKYDFVVKSYENKKLAYELSVNSDIVIIGSAPQKYIRERLKKGKITIRYSERIFKSNKKFIRCLPSLIKFKLYERNNTYLLCASAYSASDFNKLGLYKNKCYKWGYFPEVKEYSDIENRIKTKDDNSILWAARFIEWKHPEVVVQIAKKLKEDNYNFNIKMIGIGPLENKIKEMIKDNNLEDYIELLGSMSPNKVRKYMEKSKIFLFTSDKNEGWGAVLNESMNSACAVIANDKIGSAPFLIENNKNGLIYEDGNIDDLYKKVKTLLDNNELSTKLGLEAYKSMIDVWNPKTAADRIIELSKFLLENKKFEKYTEGPCSYICSNAKLKGDSI
ncbi:MAG: glycosyltransferase [Bacilli bacterium]|nr:glycosyltransferase [Bacilli bacterium]